MSKLHGLDAYGYVVNAWLDGELETSGLSEIPALGWFWSDLLKHRMWMIDDWRIGQELSAKMINPSERGFIEQEIVLIHNAIMMTPGLSMTSNKKAMLTRKDLAGKTSEQKNPLIIAIHGK